MLMCSALYEQNILLSERAPLTDPTVRPPAYLNINITATSPPVLDVHKERGPLVLGVF